MPRHLQKILYTAEAVLEGGREGYARSLDGRLVVDLSVPKAMDGSAEPGTSPEQLFAVGYAACFQSALFSDANSRKLDASESQIICRVGFGPNGHGGFGLTVALDLHAPFLTREQGADLMARAQERCPYSNATPGNIDIELSVDGVPLAALADATRSRPPAGAATTPQHRKPSTAIHPSSRTGVRFVLANPSDPSRLNDFTDWYDTYSAAITVPGYLASDVHFENPDASGKGNCSRYATIYDIVSPDPATAWPDTEHSPAYPTHLFGDPRAKLVSPALRASYALVGSQLQPGQHGPLTGIHVILSNGGGDTERQRREAQILQTGLFYSAARFRLIEGSPEPAEWLEVFETDDLDPLYVYLRAADQTPSASQIQPQLSESFRLVAPS